VADPDPLSHRILKLFETIHPMDRIARAGYVLRGVAEPENVSAHSHFVALMVLLFCEEYPDEFNTEKALIMALIHDLPEAVMMDIPMPSGDRFFKEIKRTAEQAIMEDLFDPISARYAALNAELLEGESPEARLVLACDKAQMMVKIHMYQQEGVGRLREFWANPKNFEDYGIAPVSELFDALCRQAGVERPK